MELRGTTIIGVKKDGRTIIAGDGQATLGEHVIMKSNSKKVRRIYNDKVVIGFAGSVADAFALEARFEELLQKVGNGLLITDLAGMHSGLDPISGNFSLQARGFVIENGTKGAPVSLITVAGNLFTLLNQIQSDRKSVV